MSSHADTIRHYLAPPYAGRRGESLAALDALLAENQRLREALERAEDDFSQAERIGGSLGPWLRDSRGRVRKALAGDCDGSSECKAERHLHGCYSDDGTNCDHPSEHEALAGDGE